MDEAIYGAARGGGKTDALRMVAEARIERELVRGLETATLRLILRRRVMFAFMSDREMSRLRRMARAEIRRRRGEAKRRHRKARGKLERMRRIVEANPHLPDEYKAILMEALQ